MQSLTKILQNKGSSTQVPFYLGKEKVFRNNIPSIPFIDKYNKSTVCNVGAASSDDIKAAIAKAVKAEPAMAQMPSYERKEILLYVADQIRIHSEEIATILVAEVGKTITDARGEVGRAVDTFTIAAEEAVRRNGDFQQLDLSKRNAGLSSIVSRFPVGLVSMITPFNFPINLAAHKIAPAIAVGCPFILKPSARTPLSALILGEFLEKTSLPDGAFSILPCHLEDAHLFSTDERIKMISFTGSAAVGWQLKSQSGKKKVALELGGNASCVVDQDADLDYAVGRVVFGAFYGNGQSCISVQHVHVHESIYDQFSKLLVQKASALVMGDPYSEKTFLGPMIDESESKRLCKWVDEAVNKGGKILLGGKRDAAFMEATILENVSADTQLSCQEAFGPICVLHKFSDFKQVCNTINESVYGLQAGIFTKDINKAFYAFNNLHVGGVVINEVPSARVDSMPYGGIKDSGFGREGIKYAMEEMSEMKVMLMKNMGQF
jgi:acyl-CoA reductase-like NAD-dependent aldehyde dehydrogenase